MCKYNTSTNSTDVHKNRIMKLLMKLNYKDFYPSHTINKAYVISI